MRSYDAQKEAGLHSQPNSGIQTESTATAAVEQGNPTFESIIRSVEPQATIETDRYIYIFPAWKVGRTLAQAQEIAAAIVARYGGHVETEYFKKEMWAAGVVRVWLGGAPGKGDKVAIVFTKEAAPHA